MRKAMLLLSVSVGLGTAAACQEAPLPAAPMGEAPDTDVSESDLRQQFAGNWALVRVERYDARGELMPPPEPPAFGAGQPLGFIMYDLDGHMGVVIQQEGREPYAHDQPTLEETAAAMQSYTSYFGPYTINPDEGYVIHHLLGSLSPDGAGLDNKRFYRFAGNQLFLRPPPGDTGIQLQIVWERVSELAAQSPTHRQLIGFWRIDSVERKTTEGESLPADQYADGYIIYTPSGHMAVHLMRPDRPRYAGASPTPEEVDAALRSYVSYFGPFTVHSDSDYVVHHRIGHSDPSQMGTDAQRFYEFTGNQLILQPPVATVEGQQVQSFIRWNRIGEMQ